MWRIASLLAGGLLIIPAGCSSDYLFESDLEDMVCDSTGCWHCDGGVCGEYRCDVTHQCPINRFCSMDHRCLPGAGPGEDPGSGVGCDEHADCQRGEICTLDGVCVTSPGGGPNTQNPDASDATGGDDTAGGGGDDTAGGGGDDTAGGGDDTGDPGLPDHPDDVCTHNADCGLDGVCLNGGCYFPCAADDSCPPGQLCAEGQCLPRDVPENTCTFNGECGTSHVCLEGTCYETCSESFECPDHTKCADGICVADISPVIQCSGPASCEAGEGCVDGKCLATCAVTEECGASQQCHFGYCHQIVTCFDKDDCGGADCVDGQCAAQ